MRNDKRGKRRRTFLEWIADILDELIIRWHDPLTG